MREERVAEDPMLLTVSEAAKLLRISRGLAYELVRQERIRFIRLGRRILVPRQGLEVWVAQEAGLPQQATPITSSLPQQH
jgi:excisionase family DNA binding protein